MPLTQKSGALGRLFKRKDKENNSRESGRDAYLDWEILLLSFFVLNIVAIGVSVYLYGKIVKGELFLVDKKGPASSQTLDRFALEQTVSFFAQKREKFDALQNEPVSTTDPFIPQAVPKI